MDFWSKPEPREEEEFSRKEEKKGEKGLLPKKERIRDEGEIKKLFREREIKSECPLFQIITKANKLTNSRLLVITGKKIGTAVERNRTKRVIKGIYLKNRHKIAKNIDIMIIAKKAVSKESEIIEEIKDALPVND